MASKVINLDELINDAVTVEFGDECPFCKGKDKFINSPENDFVKHVVDKHKPEFVTILGEINPEEGT
jgi:hypothetical protein